MCYKCETKCCEKKCENRCCRVECCKDPKAWYFFEPYRYHTKHENDCCEPCFSVCRPKQFRLLKGEELDCRDGCFEHKRHHKRHHKKHHKRHHKKHY